MIKSDAVKLSGKWEFIADPEMALSYEKALGLYNEKYISGKMDLPVNWQLSGLNNFNGSVWFFKKIKSAGDQGKLNILEFNGSDYFTTAWLNGIQLGTHEGYFQKFFFDLTGKLGPESLLVIRVSSPPEEPGKEWPDKKKLVKGIFNHHDCRPGGWDPQHGQDQNTGGIWNDINLVSVPQVYIPYIKITSVLTDKFREADINTEIVFYTDVSLPDIEDQLIIEITSPAGKKTKVKEKVVFSRAGSSVKFSVKIKNPELWWTWDTGSPSVYKISIKGNSINDIEETFGIREVKLDEQENFYLNGKKLFLRGTNIIPSQFLSDLTDDKINKQADLLEDANVNIIRMHAHVNRHEYYDACDRKGILVWQDFPLQWTYDESPEFAENAKRQIKNMADQFYNHPSIAFWCCHNEPGDQIKTLDPVLAETVKKSDSSRIIRTASNYEEHPYDGWYWGNKEHFAARPMGPLVTEFGAQAVPELKTLKKFLSTREISKPDLEKWMYHNFQYEQTFHIAKVSPGKNINDFIQNSQDYQSSLIQTAVDFYRSGKNSGITGIFQFMFIDCWPSITWSVVDYYGNRKKGYFTLKKVYQPLYISIKVMRDIYFAGQNLNLDIHIINDLIIDFKDCVLEFYLDDKKFASIDVPLINENSISHFKWDKNRIPLPVKVPAGKSKIFVLLKDKSHKNLSVNEFDIIIEKKLKA